jgi:hypothetical protein
VENVSWLVSFLDWLHSCAVEYFTWDLSLFSQSKTNGLVFCGLVLFTETWGYPKVSNFHVLIGLLVLWISWWFAEDKTKDLLTGLFYFRNCSSAC